MQLERLFLSKRASAFITGSCFALTILAWIRFPLFVLYGLLVGFSMRFPWLRSNLAFCILSWCPFPSKISVINLDSVFSLVVPFYIIILFFSQKILLNSLH